MKKTILLSYLSLLLTFCVPRLPVWPAGTAETIPPAPVMPAPTADVSREAEQAAPETISVLDQGEIREMRTEDYLCGVLAAEMPASFPPEALKAQAVAARSFTAQCAAAGKHGEAAVCTDYHCCQAWMDEAARRAAWGEDFDRCEALLRGVLADTEGQILCYEGAPVFAAFHSSSAGRTEDCGQVWNPRPYLLSVSSPETAEDVPDYVSTVSCWPTDFRDTLLSAHPEADFSGPVDSWLGELRLDESGRVAEAVVGGVPLRGTELRSLFSLRSTAFTLRLQDGLFVFTVTGYGHGVGMSQYGAAVMAREGADYRDILAHYYPGTELKGL